MDYAALIAQMDERRAQWLDGLPGEPGKRLRVLRPLETDLDKLRGPSLRSLAEAMAEFVTDWAGFTEADFIGAAHGSDAVVAFNRSLFARWMRDRMDIATFVGEQIRRLLDEHRAEKDQVRKN